MESSNFYIVFTDIKGYSKLTEEQIIEFQQSINKELAEKLQPYIATAAVWNTWGDAIFAAFSDGEQAVNFLLTYRKFFAEHKFGDIALKPRIASHYGSVKLVKEPLNNNRPNIYGKHINTTARMEPVTRPGEIYVSDDFKTAFESIKGDKPDIRFDTLGFTTLAKSFDEEIETYRMCLASEPKQILDKLATEDVSHYIPNIPKVNTDEQAIIKDLTKQTDKMAFIASIRDDDLMPPKPSMRFLFELAEHCKKLGAYGKCVELLEKIEREYIEVEGVQMHPFKHLPEFKKLKANALTRLGRYKEAADEMYNLWHSGFQDGETLCMLAAQYKRRAIYGELKESSQQPITLNKDLLVRARKLYVEAFRRNIDDFYPAINAAYLYHIINDKDYGRGTTLAIYIKQVWGPDKGDNWWLDATLAEAEMLAGDVEDAQTELAQAIKKHQPSKFSLASTYEQIELYAKLTNKEQALGDILKLIYDERCK